MTKVYTKDSPAPDRPAVTPAMLAAGEAVILGELGGADLGGLFSAHDLAAMVYLAMAAVGPIAPCPLVVRTATDASSNHGTI